MPEKVKSREASSAQPVLAALNQFRECLTSLVDEERRRLRMLSRREGAPGRDLVGAPHSHISTPPMTEKPPSASSVRIVASLDREPQIAGIAVAEPRSKPATIQEPKAEASGSKSSEGDSSRTDNARKRLDDLARMLDKRLKHVAEGVAKSPESKETER